MLAPRALLPQRNRDGDAIPNPQAAFRPPPPGRKPLLFYITPQGTLTKGSEDLQESGKVGDGFCYASAAMILYSLPDWLMAICVVGGIVSIALIGYFVFHWTC